MSALLTTQSPLAATLLQAIDARELPGYCPMPEPMASADDKRLAHLFRGSLKLGRIHPLYLPMLKYRHAKADRG